MSNGGTGTEAEDDGLDRKNGLRSHISDRKAGGDSELRRNDESAQIILVVARVGQETDHANQSERPAEDKTLLQANHLVYYVSAEVGRALGHALAYVVDVQVALEVLHLELDLVVAEGASNPLDVHHDEVHQHVIVLADVRPASLLIAAERECGVLFVGNHGLTMAQELLGLELQGDSVKVAHVLEAIIHRAILALSILLLRRVDEYVVLANAEQNVEHNKALDQVCPVMREHHIVKTEYHCVHAFAEVPHRAHECMPSLRGVVNE